MNLLPDIMWLPLITFAFASSVTPGPNNIMLTTSGINFGFVRTIPHIAGIALGFMVMFFCVAFGLQQAFILFPWLQDALRMVGVAYMLHLAWKIARSGRAESDVNPLKPMTMLQAALFQFVNAKAVMMAVGAVAVFSAQGEGFVASAMVIGIVFSLVNIPSVSIWAAFGAGIGKLLNTDYKLRLFNYALSFLTAASVALFFI